MELSEIEVIPRKETQFEKKNILSVEDLLAYYPKRYIDYRTVMTLDNAEVGEKCGIIVRVNKVMSRNCNMTGKNGSIREGHIIKAMCTEVESLISINIIWFNKKFMTGEIESKEGKTVAVSGILTYDTPYGFKITNPAEFSEDRRKVFCIKPVYSTIAGMSYEYLHSKIETALSVYPFSENVSEEERNHFGIITEEEMYNRIHNPADEKDIYEAKKRITFDTLYEVAKALSVDNTGCKTSDIKFTKLTNCNKVIASLPYDLTSDQKKTIAALINKTKNGERIDALVQGDVGCGKTICAFLLMIAASDNGYQSVLMAPTGVLAKQHLDNLISLTSSLGLTTVYLGGDLKAAEKKKTLKAIKDGSADFVVGTHAAVSKDVEFKNLGLTIVDEEHKFGVNQKELLKEKALAGVHSINLSATPIPRSLSIALSDDGMDIYSIYSMPSGRKPVKTTVTDKITNIYRFMLKEIEAGHKCYIVCPLIEEKDDDEDDALHSVENVTKEAGEYFGNKGIKVGTVSGKMKEDEKKAVIEEFKSGDIDVLVSTTVIEVGVDVPNATVITVMDSERFGLATLHQLRGRVGRSDLQSYCILHTNGEVNERLLTMCKSNDGFYLAEADLKFRGAGELLGVKQSGDSVEMNMMMKYPKLYKEIKEHIRKGLLE